MTRLRLSKPLVCLLDARRCVAAVEFALLAPTFVLLFAGIVDLGNAVWTWCRLEEAVAAGTGFALVNVNSVNSVSGQGLANNIANIVAISAEGNGHTTPADVTVVVNNGPTTTVISGVNATSGTAGNADLNYCPTGSPPTWTWGSAVASGSTCAGGGTSGKFVTVTASYNFTPFFASYAFVANGAITAGGMVQTK